MKIGEFEQPYGNRVGLRNKDGRITPFDTSSTEKENLCEGFPLLPPTDEITSGLHVYDNGNAAILQANLTAGQTVWVAQYGGGKMTSLQQGTACFAIDGQITPDLTAVTLQQGVSEPNGAADTVKCFLLDKDCAPTCPAVSPAA